MRTFNIYSLSNFENYNIVLMTVWSRKWQRTAVFFPGKFDGQRSLASYNPWRCKELDTTDTFPREESTFSFCINDYSHHAVCRIYRIYFYLLISCTHLPDQLPLGTAHQISVSVGPVKSLSRVPFFATPWTVAHQASLSITNSESLLKLMSIESCPSNHLILCRPLLLPPSIFPSIRVFSSESALRIRWPKYCHFSFIISPSNDYLGPISVRIDWLDLLTVQGILKSLLQHHSSEASVFPCSAFFIVQLSDPYITTGKTIALTRRTFVSRVMSLLFNMLSRLA